MTTPWPDLLRPLAQTTMSTWMQFCLLSEMDKLRFSKEDDFGYMIRDPKVADDKNVFHYTTGHGKELAQRAERFGESSAIDFIRAARALREGMTPFATSVLRTIEDAYGLPGLTDLALADEAHWALRHLYYRGGNTLAKHHSDRSGVTIPILASDAGGEYFGLDKVWRAFPAYTDQAVVFPGLSTQLWSKGAITALCHQVVPNEVTRNVPRYAIILFISLRGVRFNDQEYSTQKLEPGFNYGMATEALREMFISC